MTRRSRAALLCVAAGLLAASAFAGIVSGTVTASDTRQPLRGMVIAAYDASGSLRANATTDATGFYTLSLPAGDYRVLAYDPNGAYATAFDANAESFETSPVIPLGATQNVTVNFALARGATISGQVLTPSGTILPGAIVAAYNLSGTLRGFTQANAQGNYSLVVPTGEYKLVAYDESGQFAASFYRDATTFTDATPVRVSPPAPASISFRLGVAGRVVGTLADATTRTSLPSQFVYAYTESGTLAATTRTDAGGVFRFALPPGRYRFVSGDPERVYATAFYAGKRSFFAADVVTLTAGNITSIEIGAVRGGIVSGVVTEGTGVPLPGITVAAYNADGTLHAGTVTNAGGRYELVLAPGTYRIAAFDRNSATYATQFHRHRLSFVSADAINVAAGARIAGVDFALDRGGRFEGIVTDAATSQPLAGITVAAYDPAGTLIAQTSTGADGRYALVVPGGTYRLLAFDDQLRYATRYAAGASSFETTAERRIDPAAAVAANFALQRGVKVTGTVTDAAGNRLPGIEVFALDMSGNRVGGGVTNSSGAFAVVVTAATYKFIARDRLGRYIPSYYDRAFTLATAKSVTVTEGEPPVLSFVLLSASKRRSAAH